MFKNPKKSIKKKFAMTFSKRVLSVFLTILMLFSLFVVIPIDASAATSHTQAETVSWIKAKANEGWWQDVDGAYGCQCVDLIKAYYQYFGYDTVKGNAWEYKSGHLPAGSNWSYSGTPIPGSVFVKDKDSTWTGGHVGLVYAVEGSTIYTVETNVASPYDGGYSYAKAQYRSHPISYAVTFINPTFASPPPTDTQAPTISNIYQDNFSSTGYTLHFTASDNVGLGYVTIYTNINGNNRKEEKITLSGKSQNVSYRVNYSEFNAKTGYRNGIWLYDAVGNKCQSPWIVIDTDTELPTISNIYQDNFSNTGYTLHFTASDNVGLGYVTIYTNINGNNRKEEKITLSGKSQNVSYRVNYSEFNAKTGYRNGIWLYDAVGNKCQSPWIVIDTDTELPTISNIYQDNFSNTGYTLHFTASDNVGLGYVTIYTNINGNNRKEEKITLSGKSQNVSYRVNYNEFNAKTGYRNGIWLYDAVGNKCQSPWIVIDDFVESTTESPSQPITNKSIKSVETAEKINVNQDNKNTDTKQTVKENANKSKKANTITVKAKTKTIKAKKLKKNAQTIKALTVKNAKGNVTYKLVKKGTGAKIYKYLKINKKGVITFKKWKKAKKGTYKIKITVTAKGNSKYNAKSVTKVINIKIK